MNFLDSFLMLCERKDVPPSRALEDAGLSKSLYSKWKQKPESIPNGATLEKLAKYFMVPIDTLKGNPFGPEPTGLDQSRLLADASIAVIPPFVYSV